MEEVHARSGGKYEAFVPKGLSVSQTNDAVQVITGV